MTPASPDTLPEPLRIAVIGSTGSIGNSALDVVRNYPERFQVVALAGHANTDLLAKQVREFAPEYVAVSNPDAAAQLAGSLDEQEVWAGPEGLDRLAGVPVDVSLCAVVGMAGLSPLLAAIETGNRIALANKESLVAAGRVVMDRARRNNVDIVPVDRRAQCHLPVPSRA